MTKRPYVFEVNICRQSKIHFNNYENDLNALKNLEQRTFKKLMEGSKKSHLIILNNENDSGSENGAHLKSGGFLQKRVTNYFTVNGKKINENDRVLISPVEILSRCFFCDSITSSVYQCIQCLELYCSSCSFVKYDSFDDKRICLSCS